MNCRVRSCWDKTGTPVSLPVNLEVLQVAVMDAEGKILPAGQPGELCVRGTLPLCSTYRTLMMPLNVVFIFILFLAVQTHYLLVFSLIPSMRN